MVRYFYGFSHTYGHSKGDSKGRDIGTLYRFPTRAARDAWVAKGNDYDGPDYREAMPSTHPCVRAEKQYAIDPDRG
jgi:hypothetical protein